MRMPSVVSLLAVVTACDFEPAPGETTSPAITTGALTGWVAPPVETTNPDAFYLRVDNTWTSALAVALKPQIAFPWLAASNPNDSATLLAPGPKMIFWGRGNSCSQGAGALAATPSGSAWDRALAATGVPAANVPNDLRWTPTSDFAWSPANPLALGCSTLGQKGDTAAFVDRVGGAWWLWTTSGPRTGGVVPFWGPFGSEGQFGSNSNDYIQGTFAALRTPFWTLDAPRPFSGAGRARIRTVQSVRSMVANSTDGELTQSKQQVVLTLLNPACLFQLGGRPGPCMAQYVWSTAIVRPGVVDWSTVAWFRDPSLWFDPAQGGMPIIDGALGGLNATSVEDDTRLPLYTSQAASTRHVPFSRQVFDVTIGFDQLTNALKIVTGRHLGKAATDVSDEELATHWGAAWNDWNEWVMVQVEFAHEVYNPRSSETRAEIAGAVHEFYIGPQSQPMQETAVAQGFFCANNSSDRLFACNIGSADKPAMVSKGWSDVGDGCFHKSTGKTCSNSTYNACSSKGVFCNSSSRIVEYLCNCGSTPSGWTNVGSGCYHRNTGVACL